MERAVIYMKKVRRGGVNGYVYTGCKNVLEERDTPDEYIAGYPRFFAVDNNIVLENSEGYIVNFNVGNFVAADWFSLYLTMLKDAGKRMHRILEIEESMEFEI